MTDLEIAIKYGVTTKETSIELGFHRSSMAWFGNELVYFKENEKGWQIFNLDFSCIGNGNAKEPPLFFAPQMHEIAPLLPFSIRDSDMSLHVYNFLDDTLKNKIGIGYFDIAFGRENHTEEQEKNTNCCEPFEFHHYTEAYAQMYLKLKGEGLI